MTGGYEQFKTHEEAHKLFAQNFEVLIRLEIKDYILAVTPRPPTSKDSNDNLSGLGAPEAKGTG